MLAIRLAAAVLGTALLTWGDNHFRNVSRLPTDDRDRLHDAWEVVAVRRSGADEATHVGAILTFQNGAVSLTTKAVPLWWRGERPGTLVLGKQPAAAVGANSFS